MLKQTLVFASLFSLTMSLQALAKDGYSPDVANFEGSTSLALGADPAFDPTGTNTIEFWVAADWSNDPGYDPVIMSNASASDIGYLIAILRDRDGLGIVSGETEVMTAFDFSDGRLHHVAIVEGDGQLEVIIDGKVRATHAIDLVEKTGAELWIGTADGKTAPFMGAIGQVRIWQSAIPVQTLRAFVMADVLSETSGDHPKISALKAMSDFSDMTMLIADEDAS